MAAQGELNQLAEVLARNDRQRPQDYDDLVKLLRGASAGDLAQAKRGLGQIAERGYARNRDLATALSALLADNAR